MVFIMPGMDTAAPERTENSSGLSASPKRAPICFSTRSRATRYSCSSSVGSRLPLSKYSRQVGVVMVKPKGTGRPRRVISQRLAPLPPSRSRSSRLPSENR